MTQRDDMGWFVLPNGLQFLYVRQPTSKQSGRPEIWGQLFTADRNTALTPPGWWHTDDPEAAAHAATFVAHG